MSKASHLYFYSSASSFSWQWMMAIAIARRFHQWRMWPRALAMITSRCPSGVGRENVGNGQKNKRWFPSMMWFVFKACSPKQGGAKLIANISFGRRLAKRNYFNSDMNGICFTKQTKTRLHLVPDKSVSCVSCFDCLVCCYNFPACCHIRINRSHPQGIQENQSNRWSTSWEGGTAYEVGVFGQACVSQVLSIFAWAWKLVVHV